MGEFDDFDEDLEELLDNLSPVRPKTVGYLKCYRVKENGKTKPQEEIDELLNALKQIHKKAELHKNSMGSEGGGFAGICDITTPILNKYNELE